MTTFDPAAFDRWLTTQPGDSIERGALEDALAEKITNLFDEINVRLPEGVLATAVAYAADLAEAYVTEVGVYCEKCGALLDEDTSARDLIDPTIYTCAEGYGCNIPEDVDRCANGCVCTPEEKREAGMVEEWGDLMSVPDAYVAVLVEGVKVLLAKDDKRIDKGKTPILGVYERHVAEDIIDVSQRLTGLYYEVR